MTIIPDGIWPTMITPFTYDNKIDYAGLAAMTEWYIGKGVQGLFAVCQSSEMSHLSLEERANVAAFVKQCAAGRVPVIASGHIGLTLEDQLEEIRTIAGTGVDAFVIVTNRLADKEESDDVWKKRAETILDKVPDMPLGLYECPLPYKRLMSPELLAWCAETGRFLFLKDTCCSLPQMRDKIAAVQGTPLKLFNANTATLLDSLAFGVSGYSGVMANFHPELYVELWRCRQSDAQRAARLQSLLVTASLVIHQRCYPMNAKYHMRLEGINIGLHCRKEVTSFDELRQAEVVQLRRLCEYAKSEWPDVQNTEGR